MHIHQELFEFSWYDEHMTDPHAVVLVVIWQHEKKRTEKEKVKCKKKQKRFTGMF